MLKQAGNPNVFHTPPGYFEKLPVEIATKVHRPAAEGFSKWIPVRVAFTAACLVIIAIMGILYFGSPGKNEKASTDFTYEDLYTTGMITQMDESLLLDALTIQGNADAEVIPAGPGNDEQHLQDYLIENNTDINLIISEL